MFKIRRAGVLKALQCALALADCERRVFPFADLTWLGAAAVRRKVVRKTFRSARCRTGLGERMTANSRAILCLNRGYSLSHRYKVC
jgi:hypothetical protein